MTQKEIKEENGTTVITEKDAPAGMGTIYPEDMSECKGFPEEDARIENGSHAFPMLEERNYQSRGYAEDED